jgi:CRISPR/Cas system-associated endoribonuclease Cas2
MRYLITYDLLTPGQDYETLIKTLQTWGAKKVALSTWVIRTDSTAQQLRDALRNYIDYNDRLIVVQMTGDWATWQSMHDINTI